MGAAIPMYIVEVNPSPWVCCDYRMRARDSIWGCWSRAVLLSLALEIFLSKELGPVTVIRAPPSPDSAGDWVKFNSAFFLCSLQSPVTTCRPLSLLFPCLECPIPPSMPLGTVGPLTQPSMHALSQVAQWPRQHWPAACSTQCWTPGAAEEARA